MTRPAWYERFFGDDYLRAYRPLLGDEMDTAQDVEFIVRTLRLEPGMRVLDLCCGQGRHAVPLAARGLQVTGLDLSARLLEEAGRAAAAAGVSVEFVRADMREIRWTARFDAAVNLFTAFGYFDDDAENRKVLDGVARALGPGGRFLIDLANPFWLYRHWQDAAWSRGEGDLVITQERRLDWQRSILETRWTFIEADGRRRSIDTRLRLFPPHELASWLRRAGLEIEGFFGDATGRSFGLESLRMIAVARKG